MTRKRRWSETGTRDYTLIYHRLKDKADVDKVMGQVMTGHWKPAGQCRAAVLAARRARAEYQRAIGKDHWVTSEEKAAASYFLLTNALS